MYEVFDPALNFVAASSESSSELRASQDPSYNLNPNGKKRKKRKL